MKRLINLLLCSGFFLFQTYTQAQLPAACNGTGSAILCEQACISCNFNGFNGTTKGYPSGPATAFCGTVENAQWMGFIAGASQATFTIQPGNCNNGNGVQVAVYGDCTLPPIACDKGKENGGTTPVSITVALTPGHNYFLLIDGYAGDVCDFTVSVTPNEAVYEPPLGMVQAINGKTEGCPGATFNYSVPEVFGAAAYTWDGPPGTLVDSMPVPATVVGANGNSVQVTLGNQSGNLCAQALNSCESNPPCASSLFINILDDSHRPQLMADTMAGLSCTESPARLFVDIQPSGNYQLQWTADSTGMIVSGANTQQAQVTQTGRYTLVATNPVNGCSSSIAITVGEPELPSAADLRVQHIRCFGKNDGILNIDSVSGGSAPYVYSVDEEPFMTTPEFRRLTPGEHSLRIQAIDGCELDTVFTVEEPADLVLDLAPDTTIILGDRLNLWRPDDLSDPGRQQQLLVSAPLSADMLCDTCLYQPLHSFRYVVTVIDSNGCRAVDERVITVENTQRVYIPNAFAPDSPFENARFSIFCGTDVLRVRTFRVYNRWGRSIVEQNNLAPNDPLLGWDGRIDGELAQPAVFVFFAEIEFIDGKTEQFRGDVTLIR